MTMAMISPSRREVCPAEQLCRSPRLVLPRFRLVAAESRLESLLMIFSRTKDFIQQKMDTGGPPGGPRGRGRAHGGRARPHPHGQVVAPPNIDLSSSIFYIFQNNSLLIFRSFRELLFLHKNNTMAILLKTASVRISCIQIMQVRVQNKGKSVWKSRYDGDVSTPPSLNLCLSSSNSVDKLKVIKKNFYKLCLLLLL